MYLQIFLQTTGLYESMKIDEDNIEELILLLDGWSVLQSFYVTNKTTYDNYKNDISENDFYGNEKYLYIFLCAYFLFRD